MHVIQFSIATSRAPPHVLKVMEKSIELGRIIQTVDPEIARRRDGSSSRHIRCRRAAAGARLLEAAVGRGPCFHPTCRRRAPHRRNSSAAGGRARPGRRYRAAKRIAGRRLHDNCPQRRAFHTRVERRCLLAKDGGPMVDSRAERHPPPGAVRCDCRRGLSRTCSLHG